MIDNKFKEQCSMVSLDYRTSLSCLKINELSATGFKVRPRFGDYLFSASADLMYLASSASETWKFCISPERYWS